MPEDAGPLSGIIDRLSSESLIPPVRSVEMRGGGWIRVSVSEVLDDETRGRLNQVMGSVRWRLDEPGE